MRRKLTLVLGIATVLAVAVTGFAIAAGGGEEQPLRCTALERASERRGARAHGWRDGRRDGDR